MGVNVQSFWQAAHVVVQLDRGGRAIARAAAFDHVGIERALGQKFGIVDLGSFVCKTLDEFVSNAATLVLRIGHSGQGFQKAVFGGPTHVAGRS